MRDDEEMLQKLLRLKRYETPGDDYFERFLDEFHARMARESRERHGVKDRVFAWLEELFPSPRLGWSAAAGGMMAVVAFAFVVSNQGQIGSPILVAGNDQSPSTPRPFSVNLVQLPEVPPVPASAASVVDTTSSKPSPIIFPDLIAPVSYTPGGRSLDVDSPSTVNLVIPGHFIRQTEWENAMRLAQPETSGNLDHATFGD